MQSARIAAQPAPEPGIEEMGRGKRKRSEHGVAELGEREFERLLTQGMVSSSSQLNMKSYGPSGLRAVRFLK